MTNQSKRIQSIIDNYGLTASMSYNSYMMTMFDRKGIADSNFNGRLIAWLQDQLDSIDDNINNLQHLYAVNSGVEGWNAVTSFSARPIDLFVRPQLALSLRKLSIGYSGNAVKVRRSSDNAETDVAFDSNDEVSGSSTVSAGGNLWTWAGASSLFVTIWYDQCGAGNNATQSTALNQPQLVLNGINNKATLVFDGTSDYMITTDFKMLDAAAIGSVVVVVEPDADAGFKELLGVNNSPVVGNSRNHFGINANIFQIARGSIAQDIGSADLSTAAHILQGDLLTQPDFIGYVDSVSDAKTSTTGTPDVTLDFTIGAINDGTPVGDYSGRMSEIIMYSTVLSSVNNNLLYNNQAAYYLTDLLADGLPATSIILSLRRLYKGYSGFAVKVRRSSDNAETDVYFDANDEVSGNSNISAGGDLSTWASTDDLFMTIWYDQSGNGNNATQATAANQPQLILSAINSKAAIRGDGTDDYMTVAGVTYGANTSLFMVATPTSGTQDYLYGDNGAVGSAPAIITGFSSLSYEFFGPNAGVPRFTISAGGTGANLLELIYEDAGDVKSYFNGTEVYNAAATTPMALKQFDILFSATAVANHAACDIAEVLIFPSSLSDANRQTIESNITNFFAIS